MGPFSLPDANKVPSGEKQTDNTGAKNECILIFCPVLTFQRQIELSQLPEANVVPSGEKLTDCTGSE